MNDEQEWISVDEESPEYMGWYKVIVKYQNQKESHVEEQFFGLTGERIRLLSKHCTNLGWEIEQFTHNPYNRAKVTHWQEIIQ